MLCCYCMATGSGFTVTPAISVGSMAADLGMESAAEMGVFLSAGHWGLALVMLFSGWLGERIGLRYLLLISGVVQFCGLWLVAGAQSLTVATAASLLAGCGRDLTAAPMNAVLCAIYPRERAKVTAILHANFYIGMIVLVLLSLALPGLTAPPTWRSRLWNGSKNWPPSYRPATEPDPILRRVGAQLARPRADHAPDRGRSRAGRCWRGCSPSM